MMTQEKSTFQGERGGDAYDAELLALLRGVSEKSGAVDRFAGVDDGDDDNGGGIAPEHAPAPPVAREPAPAPVSPPAKPLRNRNSRDPSELPPWKRGKTKSPTKPKNDFMGDDDIVVAAPPAKRTISAPPPKGVFAAKEEVAPAPMPASPSPVSMNTTKSTFQGERGGDAHDEELLALLRGVSAKSGAADRFAGDEEDNDDNTASMAYEKPPDRDPANAMATSSSKIPSPSRSPSKIPIPKKPTPSRRNENELPPWKRGKAKGGGFGAPINDDVVVAVAKPEPSRQATPLKETSSEPPIVEEKKESPPLSQEAIVRGGTFQQTSTFQGERGGDAHDEELLALLRGVSAKSSADRFSGGDDNDNQGLIEQQPVALLKAKPAIEQREEKKEKEIRRMNNRNENSIPPWKRGKDHQSSKPTTDVVVASKPPPATVAEPTTEVEELPLSQDTIMGGVGNFKQTSTFKGERGGDAHDEELLALLRGVSSQSSSADRFSNGDETKIVAMPPSSQPAPPPPKVCTQSNSDTNNLPPWKRGKAAKTTMDTADVVAAVKPPAATVETTKVEQQPSRKEAIMGGGGNFEQKSTFQGDRGGDAHDPELLALLRGVSAKSSSADRSSGGVDTGELNEGVTEEAPSQPAVPAPVASPPRRSSRDPNELPPWKRGKANNQNKPKSKNVVVDVAVAAKPKSDGIIGSTESEESKAPSSKEAILGGGGDFQQPKSNFQGDRGGDAHDEELLALLRGVSAKSGGADRFSGGETDEYQGTDDVQPQKTPIDPTSPQVKITSSPRKSPPSSEKKKKRWKMTPPWKKKNKKRESQEEELEDAIEIVITSPPKKPMPETFPAAALETSSNDKEVVEEVPIEGSRGNFEQAPSNFKGERGGDAHDPELLALLRGASSSRASDRFAEADDINPNAAQKETSQQVAAPLPPPPASAPQIETPIEESRGNFEQAASNFQGERGGDAHDPELLALLRGASSSRTSARFAEPGETTTHQQREIIPPAPALPEENIMLGGRGNFKQESSFQGERGGDAHDAELLALLRGVSSTNDSSGADRFTETSETSLQPSQTSAPKHAAPKQQIASKPRQASSPFPSSSSSLPPQFPTGDGEEEIILTLEDLPGTFSDKNWKHRKTSYQVLKGAIIERTQKGERPGSVDGNTIVPGLDGLIPTLFAEKNAMALEYAMQAGTEYANACVGGASEEQATAMMNSLLKGNGLSSPRPTSAKAATALVLKIIEAGSSVNSLKSVVTLLVEKGLTVKKPKMVQLSANLILDATHSFGAAQLPLASIASALPKVLTHTNKKIRDTGMEIVAELCRSFGSKDPMESVISKMQKSQVRDLDTLLSKRADPIPTKVGLRCQSTSGGANSSKGATCAADVFAALKAGNEELEKEKFANRPAVKLMNEISKTNYASELEGAKWSKKVGALDMVLKCGGEKPYKLAQPSASNSYVPLISDMKGLLKHTHFAVVSKAMAVLAMLAQGVGEKLYPNIRPLLPKLLQLSKDKKLTKAVSACLDACFGNVFSYEHLFEPESSVSDAASESKEKNALARTSALDYLDRCVTRGNSAGPRASLNPKNAKACAKLASQKLGDSDANVRKAALQVLTSLQNVADEGLQSAVNSVVEELQQSNPRAYKTLSKTATKPAARSSIPKATPSRPKKSNSVSGAVASPNARNAPSTRPVAPPSQKSRATTSTKTALSAAAAVTKPGRGNAAPFADFADGESPTYEEALSHCETLGIPLWDEPSEEDGGILVSIQSTKWQYRQTAIKELVGFLNTCPPLDDHSQIEMDSNCLLVVVKEHTRKFKESNMNVTRCILELFTAVCDYHERSQCRITKWAAVDGTTLAVEKIADRKLSAISKALLLSMCVVHPPHAVIPLACACAEKLRAPLAHEEFLAWMKSFCSEFGAVSTGSCIQEIVAFLLSECSHKNIKVKRAATGAIGLMHAQLGPTFKTVTMASIKNPSLRDEIGNVFGQSPFDPSFASKEWPKSYVVSNNETNCEDGSSNTGSNIGIEIPKTNLITEVPSDCLSRMGSKDGKTAWKARKAALEDVEKALASSSGILDTSKLRPMVDLLRAIRDRLSDSQSNLKPLAARLIGLVLGAVEGEAQGKLGKEVYGPVMNAAMNDKRKVMNDAAMEALKRSTSCPEVRGGGVNELSLEPFVIALTSQLEGSEFKSAGIAGILTLMKSFVPMLPDLDKISSQRGATVGGRFSGVLVNALSSSKAEIRSAAESLLSECIANHVFSMKTAKKCMGRMVPAKQRTVGMILAKISSSSSESSASHPMKDASPSKTLPTRARSAIQKPRSTSKATAPKSRLAAYSKPSTEEKEEEPANDTSSNPLVVHENPTGIQKSRAAMRSLTWPEYPEEPSGAPLYNGLKKAWAPIIPPTSTKKLFPDKGIRNQSDVNDGFELVKQAINTDREDNGSAVVEQLHFILRWSVYVMGCKESAVGLSGLLDMLNDLITYLNGRMHEFSDPEVSLFIPFIFEKASVAKGRFKDTYVDLIHSIKSETLISDKRLGPFVCVPIMENSSQAKARLLACQNCYQCVETIGLSGIGKKGVLVAAKALSTEKLPENRAAFLDLMVLLVSKMQNDIQRLSKICGSSLSLKAKGMVEEHMRKAPSPSKAANPKTPSPQKPFRSSRLSQLTPPTKLSFSPKSEFVAPSVFQDELPALDLRGALREKESPSATPTKSSGLRHPSYVSSAPAVSTSSSYTSNLATSSIESDSSESLPNNAIGSSLNKRASSPIGAAASLRARLMKIREKNNMGPLPTKPSETIEIPMTTANARSNIQHLVDYFPKASQHSGGSSEMLVSEMLGTEPVLEKFLETIRKLLEKSHKIFETDEDLIDCTDVLKNIHAAVSKQANLAVMIPPGVVENIREEIRGRASEVVGILTRLIRFGFHCHPESLSAGMSIPLLSVNLASLMAIFRSNDLATLVNVDDLTILIKEAGTALLDPRLAQTTKQGDADLSQIDEATSTQMVRAINKLAVQAATGAARENSIQALIRLQDQLSGNTSLHEDTQFSNRLSRVVTKLSTRVIKAEEGVSHPFSLSSMDMETILCFLEDILENCRKTDESEAVSATKHMVKSLVTAILKVRRECTSIRQEMDDLQIDPYSSALGELVGSLASDLGLVVSNPSMDISEKNDVASLVSAVVSAAQGPERTAAIDSLKSYRAIHGDKELMNHLEDVSPAFRSYLVKEFSENPNNVSAQETTTNAMSERIKNLRSKLASADPTSTQAGLTQAPSDKPAPPKPLDQQQRMVNLRQKLNATKEALPVVASTFPSTAQAREQYTTAGDNSRGSINGISGNTAGSSLPFSSDNGQSSNPTINAFRERLAAAKEKQTAMKSVPSPMPTTSASSRAAALRARLQAVKAQTQL